jgi:hypothetical protein
MAAAGRRARACVCRAERSLARATGDDPCILEVDGLSRDDVCRSADGLEATEG